MHIAPGERPLRGSQFGPVSGRSRPLDVFVDKSGRAPRSEA